MIGLVSTANRSLVAQLEVCPRPYSVGLLKADGGAGYRRFRVVATSRHCL